MNRTLIPALLALVILASCTSATEPVADVSATVVQHTVTPNGDNTPGSVVAILQIVIDNRTGDDAYLSGCNATLERQDAELQWVYVWSPVCPMIAPANPLDGMTRIPAGFSREVSVHVWSYVGAGDWPFAGIEGTYRVRMSIAFRLPVVWRGLTGAQLNSQRLTTNEFTLAPD